MDDEIVIERREVVARVPLSSTRHPLEAAYSAIGTYYGVSDLNAGNAVEFVHFGRTFRASVDQEDASER